MWVVFRDSGCEPEDAVGTSCLKKGFSASVAVTVGNTFSKVWMDPSPESSVCGDTVVLIGIISAFSLSAKGSQ